MPAIDVSAKASDRPIDGMVMHGQMADHHNSLRETISMRRIHRYLVDRRDRLLPVADTRHPDAIPVARSNFTRQAVESETKPKAVETGMRERCKGLYDAGGVAAAHVICEPVRDVDGECEYADRSAPSSSAVDYGMQAIVPMRHGLHGKYGKRPHGVGKKPSWG